MLKRWKFLMSVIGQSGKQTEEHTEKGHVPLLLMLSIVVLIGLIVGGIPAAIHFHEYAGVATAVILATVGIGGFIYYIAFEGYYAIYCEECMEKDRMTIERDIAVSRVSELEKEMSARLPGLSGVIEQTVVGEIPNDQNLSMLLVTISITNRGEPSIADK
jgi:hypothetical protein